MPWLLYRYVLGELLRTILLATGVLVAVIAFGATVKPLASGKLAPVDVAKYVALAIVPMLQFALPFAAGFGSTIVMHRLVTDNEALACAASGVSYRRFLLPVLGLGLAITLLLLVLVYFVVPRFWVLMQRAVTEDIARLFDRAVDERGAFVLGNLQIYAEGLDIIPNPPDTGASKRLVLRRVAAAELNDAGEIVTDVTARSAVVDIHERREGSFLMLALEDAVAFNRQDGSLARIEVIAPQRPILLPETLVDKPKFMSLGQILQVRRDRDGYREVKRRKQQLADALTRHATMEMLREGVAAGSVEFTELHGAGRYVVRADRIQDGTLTRAGAAPVEVVEYEGEREVRRLACAAASVTLTQTDPLGLRLGLLLRDCLETRPNDAGMPPIRRAEVAIVDLRPPGDAASELEALPSAELLARAAQPARTDREVAGAVRQVEFELADLGYETAARLHQRAALATTGLLLVMLGSLLALVMRNTLPLTIYLLAFLPSILDMLLISGGEQTIRDNNLTVGAAVMWSGNALLAALSILAYLRLRRN